MKNTRVGLRSHFRTVEDALYAYITTVAFAHNVVAPTEALAGYISMFNTYIDEANTAYNQRMAQGKKEDEETDTPETPEEEVPADNG